MLKELYYWMCFYVRRVKTNDTPEFNSMFLISIFYLLNFATINIIIKYFWGDNFYTIFNSKSFQIFFALFFISIPYYFLYYKRKKIFEKYDNKSEKRRTIGKICFFLYLILSVITLYLSVEYLFYI